MENAFYIHFPTEYKSIVVTNSLQIVIVRLLGSVTDIQQTDGQQPTFTAPSLQPSRWPQN